MAFHRQAVLVGVMCYVVSLSICAVVSVMCLACIDRFLPTFSSAALDMLIL